MSGDGIIWSSREISKVDLTRAIVLQRYRTGFPAKLPGIHEARELCQTDTNIAKLSIVVTVVHRIAHPSYIPHWIGLAHLALGL
jgi:hypothetical protein